MHWKSVHTISDHFFLGRPARRLFNSNNTMGDGMDSNAKMQTPNSRSTPHRRRLLNKLTKTTKKENSDSKQVEEVPLNGSADLGRRGKPQDRQAGWGRQGGSWGWQARQTERDGGQEQAGYGKITATDWRNSDRQPGPGNPERQWKTATVWQRIKCKQGINSD